MLKKRAQDAWDVVEMRSGHRPALNDLDHREVLRVQAVELVRSLFRLAECLAKACQEIVHFLQTLDIDRKVLRFVHNDGREQSIRIG